MSDASARIRELCRSFHLPTVGAEAEPRFVAAGQGPALSTLAEVFELEADDRRQRRITRLRYASKLPPGKTAATFDATRLPPKLQHQLDELASAAFLERSANVLAFGLPGTGKTHAACALGHRLIEAGHAVYFTPAYRLVQELLAAKRDLALPRALRKLDQFEVLILDDLGYVQQDAAEAEVLFTLLAERYERRSLVITSNLVFSQWEQIFRNPMATAAAIDRIVHHSVILEFDVASYRTEAAQRVQRENPESAAPRPKSRPADRSGRRARTMAG
jgi:DNA replication protein DnaC